MITIATNSLGSGDWVVVMNRDEVIFSGHSISPHDLVNIVETASDSFVKFVELDDEDMEQWS